ncbi:hypothetical protein ACWDA8_07255, partial [Streptomyces sp. NPDC001130]
MTNTKERVEDTHPLVYQCRLPLSTRTVNHLADLLRRHLNFTFNRSGLLQGMERCCFSWVLGSSS